MVQHSEPRSLAAPPVLRPAANAQVAGSDLVARDPPHVTLDSAASVDADCHPNVSGRAGCLGDCRAQSESGADHELFKFNPDTRSEVRKQLRVSSDDVLVVDTGKIVPVKGPHILVTAAISLLKRHPAVKVLLVGNGPQPYVESIRQEIRQAGADDRFIWNDAVSNAELARFYSAADVGVWPREASLSMIEAMSCSLPVIISDASEITERIQYDNGFTYRGDDPASLSVQMERLLEPGLRKMMGANGRKLVEEKLSWKSIAAQVIALVE